MENRMSALEGRFDSMEATLEDIQAEWRGMARKANRDRGRRRNQRRSSEGSRDSVNAERKRRPPEKSEDEAEEDRGDVQRSGMKRIKLPTFEGVDPMGWIAKAEKFFDLQNLTERKKMKLVYTCMERGASYYWIRFWRKKTRHPNWKIFTEALTRRFGELNRDTVCEELAAERQEGSVNKDFQELGNSVPQASGKPDHSFSVSVDLGAGIINGVEAVGAIERRSDTFSLIGDPFDLGSTMMNSDCFRNDKETKQNNSANRPFNSERDSSVDSNIDDKTYIYTEDFKPNHWSPATAPKFDTRVAPRTNSIADKNAA